MAECRSVCEHLHLPVQSGDDGVLRRMGRQYTIEHYLERLERIRAAVPGIAISTDVIVGFCGETEEQYEATLRLLEAVRYDQVFAAAFSPRPGTPAARLPDDVPAAVKRRRLNDLLALQEGIGLERNRAWLGRTVEVLVDQAAAAPAHEHEHADAGEPTGEDAPGEALGEGLDAEAPGPAARLVPGPGEVRLAGRTRQSKLVHLVGSPGLVGRAVDVVIDHAGPFSLRGRLA